MDFPQLISNFAERHGIANLAAEDNAAAIDIDGIVITFVVAGNALSVVAEIGEPPPDGRGEFAELMLEANLQSEFFFAKAAGSDNYIIVRRIALVSFDSNSFDQALEAIVNYAETWRRLLADYRPAAKAAAESAESEAASFGSNEFMQV